jgi:hypothetical protein
MCELQIFSYITGSLQKKEHSPKGLLATGGGCDPRLRRFTASTFLFSQVSQT